MASARLWLVGSLLPAASGLPVLYRLAVDPDWGCVSLLGQTALSLVDIHRELVDSSNLLERWVETTLHNAIDYQEAEIRGYCGAFSNEKPGSVCATVPALQPPLILSPLLRSVKDVYIANNFYLPSASFNMFRSLEELDILDANGECLPGSTWMSDYTFSQDGSIKRSCLYSDNLTSPCRCSEGPLSDIISAQIDELLKDDHLAVVQSEPYTYSDAKSVRVLHTGLASLEDIALVSQFIQEASTSNGRHFIRFHASASPSCRAHVGSWVASLTLKNTEYKTINEAQSAGDDTSDGMQAAHGGADDEGELDADFDVEESREISTGVTLSELVKNRHLLQSFGTRTLSLIATELASLKASGTSELCLHEHVDADETQLETLKLECLAEIVANIPSFIEDMYSLNAASSLRSNLKRSLNALHREIHPRWNALLMNSRTLGSSPSSSSMSPSMHLGYIFDMLSTEIQPLAYQHAKFLGAGLSPKEARDLLQGRRSKDVSDSLFDVATAIYNGALNASEAGAAFWQFARQRWDYRQYPVSIPLRKHTDFAGLSRGNAITPNNFLANLRKILVSERSSGVLAYDLEMHEIHVVVDLGVMEDVQFLNEVLAHNEILNGASLSVIIATSKDNTNGLKLAKLISLWSKTGDACGLSRWSDVLDLLMTIEDENSFSTLKRLKCVDVTEDDIHNFVEEPKNTGLKSPSVFVNGQGIQFARGSLPLGVNGASDQTLLQQLLLESKKVDFRSILYSLISMTSPMFTLGEPPLGAQIFQGVSRNSDLSKIFASAARTRLLPAASQILMYASKSTPRNDVTYDSVWPTLRDFHLISSSPVVMDTNPLSSIRTFKPEDVDDVASVVYDFIKTAEKTLEVSSPPPPLSHLGVKGSLMSSASKTANITLPAMPLIVALYTENSTKLQDPAAWEMFHTTVQRALATIGDKMSMSAHVSEIMVTSAELGIDNSILRMLPRQWQEAVAEQKQTMKGIDPSADVFLIRSPTTFIHTQNLIAGIRDASASTSGAFATIVLDCLAKTSRHKYATPMCPHLLPQNVSHDVAELWWDHAVQKLFADETVLKPSQSSWNAWSLFDKSSLKSIRLSASNDDTFNPINVKAIVDPLSKWGQYIVPLLSYLYSHLDAQVQILLNPSSNYNELPLNRWTRNVMQPPLTEGDNLIKRGREAAQANFSRVSTSETLTGALESPSHWAVITQEARLDLDNIRAKNVEELKGRSSQLTVDYEIQGLYIEGLLRNYLLDGSVSESDFSGGNSFVLNGFVNGSEVKSSDTISIRRPDYYQLRVQRPDRYVIRMLNNRTSVKRKMPGFHDGPDPEEITELFEVSLGDSSLTTVSAVPIEIDSFDAALVPLSIIGKQIQPDHDKSYLGSALKSLWGYLPKGSRQRESELSEWDSDTVHIFSLASGHLYERLLRIMTLSVRKNTNRKLVFWILDNFLSAKFKERMHRMTQIYPDLQVRYVTYKWPSFLRPQVEKQRQIWAYKILFLDVLFPLHVSKIIYIDADQVVKADVGELWDLDLEGKVYGFTPFCNDRKETAKFRFWDSGYWEKHLDGRPYHISALFVVDLIKFREQQVGSDLREIYNTLSADPNSLANLDQDLPNFAQGSIPIFSLPQEWLWCETWCSDQRKKYAKTIDLCNNPLTHESKLKQATRIVEEWVSYDQELQDKLDEESILESQPQTGEVTSVPQKPSSSNDEL